MYIGNLKIQRGIITTDPMVIRRKIKEYYGQFYVHEFGKLVEFGKLDEWTNSLEQINYQKSYKEK